MYHATELKQTGTIQDKMYHIKKLRGKEREYDIHNPDLSTEQVQKIVDMLVESVFKQMGINTD
jgi:hypothetical protein